VNTTLATIMKVGLVVLAIGTFLYGAMWEKLEQKKATTEEMVNNS